MRMRIVLLLALSSSVFAQTPYLVRDLNTTSSTETESSGPSYFILFHDRIFFTATTQDEGTELWTANPTGGDARLAADIIPGEGSSTPQFPRIVNDVLLFSARDVNHGVEIWTSDGTPAGTHLLLDLSPGPNSSNPAFGVMLGNRLMFNADDGIHGVELWSTDGTAAGTHIVKDIAPDSASSNPTSFVLFNGVMYFGAAGGLWKTDGTESGTVKVATVSVRVLTTMGGKLYFAGDAGGTGRELWTSDGTEAGTHLLKEIRPGSAAGLGDPNGIVTPFGVIGNRLLFPANDGVHGSELWVSDGTADGTRLLHEFVEGAAGMWDQRLLFFTLFGGRAYFAAQDAEHGNELWVTDGTNAGTTLFADIEPGEESSEPFAMVVAGANLYMTAGSDGYDGRQLWVTDGLSAPRVLAASRVGVSYGFSLWSAGGRLYFSGRDRLTGTEPWTTDGTDAGTKIVANIARDRAPSSDPRGLLKAGNLLYFWAAETAYNYSFWRSDGTASGTFELFDSNESLGAIAAGPFVLLSETYHGPQILTDGTTEGTGPANVFLSRFGGAKFRELYAFGDTLYVDVEKDHYETELWKTTAERVAPATPLGISGHGLIDVAGDVWFYTKDGLWNTDGTPSGTHPIVPDLGHVDDLGPLVNAEGTVYFLIDRRDEDPALWKSDGTFDGTTLVKTLPWQNFYWAEMAAAGRRVFIHIPEALWVSDGTEAGTVELAKLPRAFGDSGLPVAVGNGVVFTHQNDHDRTYELWTSDGTPAGTKRLRILGAQSTVLTSVDGIVYFQGFDEEHGYEIWTTDGTEAGTKLLIDLQPGKGSSSPSEFTKVGNTLYFNAYTDQTGAELWALPLTNELLSVRDTRIVEGESVLRFPVSLTAAATHPVTVDYGTSDGTAQAGPDYDATSGTLTFAPGEISKTIEVRVHGDAAPENNEIVYVTLRNAAGANLLGAEAAGIVEDDDQAADLRLSFDTSLTVTNDGPRAATELDVDITETPGSSDLCQYGCGISQLAPGQTAPVLFYGGGTGSAQKYYGAFVSARQHDPNPANNSVHWTTSWFGDVVMNRAFLHPGETATTLARHYSTAPSVAASSDPTVVSISPLTTVDADRVKATVTALKTGTSTITVDSKPLLVTVLPAGSAPRWAGGVTVDADYSTVPLDRPVMLTVTPARSPLNGARATGTVIVSRGGQELARGELRGAVLNIPLYLTIAGSVVVQIDYSGDANFLPQSFPQTVYTQRGNVSITNSFERAAGTNGSYVLTFTVAGSPIAAPTGSLSITPNGVLVPLIPGPHGVSTATTTLSGLSVAATLTVSYSGDNVYQPAVQQVRLIDRRRTSRH